MFFVYLILYVLGGLLSSFIMTIVSRIEIGKGKEFDECTQNGIISVGVLWPILVPIVGTFYIGSYLNSIANNIGSKILDLKEKLDKKDE